MKTIYQITAGLFLMVGSSAMFADSSILPSSSVVQQLEKKGYHVSQSDEDNPILMYALNQLMEINIEQKQTNVLLAKLISESKITNAILQHQNLP